MICNGKPTSCNFRPLAATSAHHELYFSPSASVCTILVNFLALQEIGAPMLSVQIPTVVIIFLDWSFDHYVVPFFVSFHSLYLKVYFIWYEYCDSSFLLVSVCVKYFFPALHFCSVCVPCFEVGLLQTAYIGVLFFFIHSSSLCLLVGAFNPFTFKMIIDKYDPVAIYFIVLCSSSCTLSGCFLSKEDHLAFVGELVWWCWILSAFACF